MGDQNVRWDQKDDRHEKMIPTFSSKLKKGDCVRVITPARSLSIIDDETREFANNRFKELGLQIDFGKHVEESDICDSSSIVSRVEDLHAAFVDEKVKGIFTVIGGYNSNQLLRYIDWDLIRNNPKILCGFSDITALQNAIFTKTGLVTYSGPHYSTFAQKHHFDYTLEYVRKCLFNDQPFFIKPSQNWSDDKWWINQEERNLIPNPGWLIINEGEASGIIVGGNLGTFSLLFGTEYCPSLKDKILFIEDDFETKWYEFDRRLQSLIHQPEFSAVKGIVVGRFQIGSGMTDELLIKSIKTKKELDHMPIIANVDFGHSDPKITWPIGGEVAIHVSQNESFIEVSRH